MNMSAPVSTVKRRTVKRTLLYALCGIALVVSMFGISSRAEAAPAPWEGMGSKNNPYKIADCEDVYQIGQLVYSENTQYRTKHFRQVDHIDCNGWDNNASPFLPIGTGDDGFYGTYDGQGYDINGMRVATSGSEWQYSGMFGYSEGATFRNIRLVGVTASAYVDGDTGAIAGILGGYAYNPTVENVSVVGSVEVATESSASALTFAVGGLFGTAAYGEVHNSFADADVSVASSSTSTEMAHYMNVGGFIGDAYGIDIENSYSRNNMDIEGGKQQLIGGFIGALTYENGQGGSVTNSFSSINTLNATTAIANPEQQIGSFVGSRHPDATITGGYALELDSFDVVGNELSAGITEIANSEPGDEYFFDPENAPMDTWCFAQGDGCDAAIWQEDDENTPRLLMPPAVTDSPYLYGTVTDQSTEEVIEEASLHISCDNASWTSLVTTEDGYYEVAMDELAEAINTAGCSDGDTLLLRASADDYNDLTIETEPTMSMSFLGTYLAETREQNFSLTSPAAIEDAGPNNGDGNNDTIPDSEQSNVHSFINPVTDQYVVLEVDEECYIYTAAVNAVEAGDDGTYNYPAGMMNFTLECEDEGYTTNVKQYFYGVTGNFIVRKHNPDTGQYWTINGAMVSDATIGGQAVKVSSYQITDGGELDLDGEANAAIFDPAGLATTDSMSPNDQLTAGTTSDLARTGQSKIVFLAIAGSSVALSYMFVNLRKHLQRH